MTTVLQPMRQRPGKIPLKAPVNHSLLWLRDRLGLFGWLCDTSIDQRKHSLHWQGQNTKSMLPLLTSPSFWDRSPQFYLSGATEQNVGPLWCQGAFLFLLSLQVFFLQSTAEPHLTPTPWVPIRVQSFSILPEGSMNTAVVCCALSVAFLAHFLLRATSASTHLMAPNKGELCTDMPLREVTQTWFLFLYFMTQATIICMLHLGYIAISVRIQKFNKFKTLNHLLLVCLKSSNSLSFVAWCLESPVVLSVFWLASLTTKSLKVDYIVPSVLVANSCNCLVDHARVLNLNTC